MIHRGHRNLPFGYAHDIISNTYFVILASELRSPQIHSIFAHFKFSMRSKRQVETEKKQKTKVNECGHKLMKEMPLLHAFNNKVYLFFFRKFLFCFQQKCTLLQNSQTLKVKNTKSRWRWCSYGECATQFSAQNKLEWMRLWPVSAMCWVYRKFLNGRLLY